MKYDVIVIGAGAAGLLAAWELARTGKSVAVLEAAPVAGGRIRTLTVPGFDTPAEAGPEFIHGDLPLTFMLLHEAGLTATETAGAFINVTDGKWNPEDDGKDWAAFMRQLAKQEKDVPVATLLAKHFPAEKYAALHQQVKDYAQGFDLADISRVSALFVRREWTHQEEPNYRIYGGYGALVGFLEAGCLQKSVTFFYNRVVNSITYTSDDVIIHTANGGVFNSSKVVVTVSLGVLQSKAIAFNGLPATYENALQQLGFGAVIKVLLQFTRSFWEDYADDIGFILSNAEIPTWWTQAPKESAMLTGWLGGPPAAALSLCTEDVLLQTALQSLSGIFHTTIAELQEQLVAHTIICWQNEPYVKGGYSYVTTEAVAAKQILQQPVNNTIFFAGEAFYSGESQGTVEAALQTGLQAATLINALA